MQDQVIDARPSDEPPSSIHSNAIIGVDVAKAAFVVARHGGRATQAIANSPAAIRAWLKAVPAGACIAMESTGRYHLELASQAKAAGFSVYVLNAMDVHHYAKAMGQRGKTDPLDAHLITQYVAHQLLGQGRKRLRPWQPTPRLLGELRDLHRARVQLADSCARLTMALEHVAVLEEEGQALRAHFKKLMAQIDAKVATLLTRIGFANSDAVVAYSGLDPRPADSGSKRGKRKLSKKGDPHLRRQLYLCAMAATRSALFRPMYEALKGRGLPSTAALVVLARKLLRIAFAVWRSGQAFEPSKLLINATPA